MHFIGESDQEITPQFMSDEAYAEARACLPFVCTDAIITEVNRKIVYLAWRQVTPARGWWLIGGGVKNGQSPAGAMAKNFYRETSLDLPEERFELLTNGINLTQWTTEEQISSLHLPFKIELGREEKATAQANLDKKEYTVEQGLRPFTLDELLKIIQEGTGCPQPVLYYDCIFDTNAYPAALKIWHKHRSA